MVELALRLLEDRLDPHARVARPPAPANRVIYVVRGEATIEHGGTPATRGANQAWHGAGAAEVTAGPEGAHLLRWELVNRAGSSESPAGDEGGVSRLKLWAPVALAQDAAYLMRCDRVDFPPGGIAYLHTHQGPGIRCLLFGELTVSVSGSSTTVEPLGAWFEAGPGPVFAAASATEPSAFVRVMILPRALEGKSSISYVNAEDRDKPKSQRYTIFLDEAIAL